VMEEAQDDEWHSIRDPRIPLGRPRASRVELGETVQQYYRRKHATQGYGKYYGPHEVNTTHRW
jgi:hypothetical protein